MKTTTLAAAPGTILAINLGKYKRVACAYDRATARAASASVATSRAELLRLLDHRHPQRSPPRYL